MTPELRADLEDSGWKFENRTAVATWLRARKAVANG